MNNDTEKQILKLAKILSKFSMEDLSSYMENSTDVVTSALENLCKIGKLKKVSENEYFYVKPTDMQKCEEKDRSVPYLNNVFDFEKNGLFNLENFRNFPAEKVFQRKSDLEYFKKCPAPTQKTLVKNVILLLLLGNLTTSESRVYLKSLAKKNPEYRMNAQWYKIKLKRFLADGVPGLLRTQIGNIDNESYEVFKKLYLSSKRYSQYEAYLIMKATINDESKLYTLSTYSSRLRKEFSQAAIKKMRSITKQEEINDEIKSLQVFQKYDKPETIKFEDAANNYWNAVIQNNLEITQTKVSHIKKLKSYFGNFLLGEISYAEMQKYRKHLISKGISILIARTILQTLSTIMKISGIDIDYQIYCNMSKDVKLLSLNKIKEIIQENTPQTWVIATGLKIPELENICYEDINFETHELTLLKCNRKNQQQFYTHNSHVRRLKIPVLILDKLDRNKTGKIFEDVRIIDYEKYLYAHIMLMLSQNVSINIISKNLGYKSLHTFEMLFGHLLPNELDKDFDIFNALQV